jgi:hypothetical protein
MIDEATKADERKFHKLNALLDGKTPPEEPSGLSSKKFRSLVAESKVKRIKAWAEETGVEVDHLQMLIDEPGSGLVLTRPQWVKLT